MDIIDLRGYSVDEVLERLRHIKQSMSHVSNREFKVGLPTRYVSVLFGPWDSLWAYVDKNNISRRRKSCVVAYTTDHKWLIHTTV